MRIAVLLTCFNRKLLTLNCIETLINQEIDELSIDIYLVNDGCTDGTSEAVLKTFPDVNVITGSGSLFWNGGMRLAWKNALDKDYDFFLWVNDDAFIYSDSIKRILSSFDKLIQKGECVGALLGTMVDPSSKKPTYGGRIRNSLINPISFGDVVSPSDTPQKCNFVNGNFTLIPKESVTKIGILSEKYTHSMGDFDYGLRLQEVGLSCWVAPGVYGECETNSEVGGCKDKNLSFAERQVKMKNISQLPPVNEWMYFVRRHAGYVWPLLWLKAWLRGQFPKLWLLIN